jgi:hypothetical protein
MRAPHGAGQVGAAHLRQALEIFQRMAMQPDADRVQARLGQLTGGIPREM